MTALAALLLAGLLAGVGFLVHRHLSAPAAAPAVEAARAEGVRIAAADVKFEAAVPAVEAVAAAQTAEDPLKLAQERIDRARARVKAGPLVLLLLLPLSPPARAWDCDRDPVTEEYRCPPAAFQALLADGTEQERLKNLCLLKVERTEEERDASRARVVVLEDRPAPEPWGVYAVVSVVAFLAGGGAAAYLLRK